MPETKVAALSATTNLQKPDEIKKAIGCVLKYGEAPESLKEIPGLISYAELGGSAEKLDTTTQQNKKEKTSQIGLIDHGDMVFTFEQQGTNKADLKKVEHKMLFWQFLFPDGEGYQWWGQHHVKEEPKDPGNKRDFAITVLNASEFEAVTGAGA